MFNKNNRYVTRGINEEVDIRIQIIMWGILDDIKKKGDIELDYLQIFKLRKSGNKVIVEQSQEVPEYSSRYEIELQDVEIDREIKVYIIDNGIEGSTMLFPREY